MTEARWQHRVVETASPDETIELGESLSGELQAGDVLVLEGPLGSGKTVLVRGIVAGLGGDARLVGSPTFGLAHEYEIRGNLRVVHVDCYRINGPADLDSIGWDSFAGVGDAITIVEWGSRVDDALDGEVLTVDAGHLGDSDRVFELGRRGSR
ncbi:MAG: tRNA (adenosine(37)-N6)-threonylcarbamoyltransferase complex ATPase subunit type 1 TsaE [Phycisphaerae bacterium]|nr:tRNA (adenosine(37)-N6)-threonylcarbamoyltransferase complex ATPase subunit type 1 TsaE [Phycisphaerae bacterium]|tara:strand:+ start:654 stop:1112 length:459 start_codon:yes stop_codon:yes gene_type:complete